MAVMHPVFAALSLAGSLACACVTRGPRRAVRLFGAAAVLALVAAVANLAFSSLGATELFRIGARPFTLEALVYGLCSGAMLASVLLWFSSYAVCMGSDATLALFGSAAPTVSLMVSQVLRLVPQFVARGRDIVASQEAMTSAASRTKRDAASDRLRAVSVLAGWGMEDGLVRGDAMRARGFGCGEKRTSYRRYRVRRADAAAIAIVLALAVLSGAGAAVATAGFSFYPEVGAFAPPACYVPYLALMAVPAGLAFKEWLVWR